MKSFHFLTLSAAILLFANANAYTVDSSTTDTALHLARRDIPSSNDVTAPASAPPSVKSESIPAVDNTSAVPDDAAVATQPAVDVQAEPSPEDGSDEQSTTTAQDEQQQQQSNVNQDPSVSTTTSTDSNASASPDQQPIASSKQDGDDSDRKSKAESVTGGKAKKAKHNPAKEEASTNVPEQQQPVDAPVASSSPPAGQAPIVPEAGAPPLAPASPAVDGPHPVVVVQDEDNFCMFLPPQPGMDVATNEDFGVPFCSRKGIAGDNQEFPEDFVTKKHVESTSGYIQVTGYIDPTKYGLLTADQGGQYDNHGNGKPIGAQCQGWKYFVNLLEPANQRFCIRCCKSKADCNTGRSEYGCPRVIPGDYSDFDLVADVLEVLAAEDTPTTAIPLGQHVQSFIDTVLASGDAGVSKRSWNAFIDGLMNQYITHQDLIARVAQTTAGVTTQDDWLKFCNDLKGIVDLPSESM